MALVPSGKAFLLLQELVERVGVFAVYLQLLEPRELCSVCELAEVVYRFVCAGCLLAELVAREIEYLETF